ncbi:MAG: sulfatase [Thermoanaerobaculia bacterium]
MNRTVRRMPVAAILPALLIAACSGPHTLPTPRGIVILVVDTLRSDFVGAYGARWPATPQIDRLASEGVLFEHAFAQGSWTRPSVPSILTGLYPSEHHLVDFVSSQSKSTVQGAVLSDEADTLAESMQAAGYRTALAGFQFQLSPRFHLNQGFDAYASNLKGGAVAIQRHWLDWLDRDPKRPFFSYLHYLDLHWPYCPPGRIFGRFDPEPSEMDVCRDAKGLKRRLESGELVPDEAGRRALSARYAETLAAVDEQIGQLFDELRRRGVWDETLIIVTADHGQELGDHGGYDHGTSLYDELLHVPLVWKLPRSWNVPPGQRVAELVELRSIDPTLREVVHRPLPPRARSLVPWLLGRASGGQTPGFVAAESNGMFAVRDATHKLIVEPAKGTAALFDLRRDPEERVDVSSREPDDLARMRGYMRSWRGGLVPLPLALAPLDDETARGLKALGYIQ